MYDFSPYSDSFNFFLNMLRRLSFTDSWAKVINLFSSSSSSSGLTSSSSLTEMSTMSEAKSSITSSTLSTAADTISQCSQPESSLPLNSVSLAIEPVFSRLEWSVISSWANSPGAVWDIPISSKLVLFEAIISFEFSWFSFNCSMKTAVKRSLNVVILISLSLF